MVEEWTYLTEGNTQLIFQAVSDDERARFILRVPKSPVVLCLQRSDANHDYGWAQNGETADYSHFCYHPLTTNECCACSSSGKNRLKTGNVSAQPPVDIHSFLTEWFGTSFLSEQFAIGDRAAYFVSCEFMGKIYSSCLTQRPLKRVEQHAHICSCRDKAYPLEEQVRVLKTTNMTSCPSSQYGCKVFLEPNYSRVCKPREGGSSSDNDAATLCFDIKVKCGLRSCSPSVVHGGIGATAVLSPLESEHHTDCVDNININININNTASYGNGGESSVVSANTVTNSFTATAAVTTILAAQKSETQSETTKAHWLYMQRYYSAYQIMQFRKMSKLSSCRVQNSSSSSSSRAGGGGAGYDASWGSFVGVSSYDPLDLCSLDAERVKSALIALIENPQNNLRIFYEGKPVYGWEIQEKAEYEDAMLAAVCACPPPPTVLKTEDPPLMQESRDRGIIKQCESVVLHAVCEIFRRESVLRSLVALQSLNLLVEIGPVFRRLCEVVRSEASRERDTENNGGESQNVVNSVAAVEVEAERQLREFIVAETTHADAGAQYRTTAVMRAWSTVTLHIHSLVHPIRRGSESCNTDTINSADFPSASEHDEALSQLSSLGGCKYLSDLANICTSRVTDVGKWPKQVSNMNYCCCVEAEVAQWLERLTKHECFFLCHMWLVALTAKDISVMTSMKRNTTGGGLGLSGGVGVGSGVGGAAVTGGDACDSDSDSTIANFLQREQFCGQISVDTVGTDYAGVKSCWVTAEQEECKACDKAFMKQPNEGVHGIECSCLRNNGLYSFDYCISLVDLGLKPVSKIRLKLQEEEKDEDSLWSHVYATAMNHRYSNSSRG